MTRVVGVEWRNFGDVDAGMFFFSDFNVAKELLALRLALVELS